MPLRFNEAEETPAAARAADLAGERPGFLARSISRSISGVVTAGARRLRDSHSPGQMHGEIAPLPALEGGSDPGCGVPNGVERPSNRGDRPRFGEP
jgi:hypothetical protein